MPCPRLPVLRVTDRASFEALRRGRRGRAGDVTVSFTPVDSGPPAARVAFRVGKSTGGAVVRNRIRRRLRAAMRQLAHDGRLAEGAYLIGARGPVADQAWPSLVDDLGRAVDHATRPPGGGS